jgi:multisubunit Na+/H+ antiporter MnhB subunit
MSYEILLLLIFMIMGAIIAIETRDLLSTIIAIGAVGFGLSIMFLFLGAPDLAITQVVVEVIALVVLIRATVTRDDTTHVTHADTFAIASVLVFFGLFILAASVSYGELQPFGKPLMRVSREYFEHWQKNKATNIVGSIILDFRAYDTLGEATVLFTSVIGAFVILRKVGKKAS